MKTMRKVTTNTLCSMPHSLCFTIQAQWVLCLISLLQWVKLFLFLQSSCLLIWWEWKEWIVGGYHLCVVSFVFHLSDWAQWVLCLISAHDSMVLPLLLQNCCLLIWWLWERDDCLVGTIYVLFLLSSPLRSSFASAVFDFNASLNDVVPVPLMWFPFYDMRIEKNRLLMDAICVLFLLCSPHR